MFGRFTIMAATAAAVLTASPALAASENPTGGQMGGMWTQEAPTNFFGMEMGAVLAPRVQYLSGGGPNINFRYGLGGGGEIMTNVGATFTTAPATSFAANLGAGYKQQLTRAGNMAMAFKVGGNVNSIGGAGAIPIGFDAGLPMTFDAGSMLLSLYPGIWSTNVTSFGTSSTVGAGLGVQAPMANFWSFLAEARPGFALGANSFTMPVNLGARLSPNALSHVDFTVANLTVTPGFGLTVGTVGVMGHIGFR